MAAISGGEGAAISAAHLQPKLCNTLAAAQGAACLQPPHGWLARCQLSSPQMTGCVPAVSGDSSAQASSSACASAEYIRMSLAAIHSRGRQGK